jgi:hypothetical protein
MIKLLTGAENVIVFVTPGRPVIAMRSGLGGAFDTAALVKVLVGPQ